MKTKIVSFLIIVLAFSSLQLEAQIKTSVNLIRDNATPFLGQHVEVRGLVLQYIPGSPQTVAHYIIRDDMGSSLKIISTLDPPKTNKKYIVRGVLRDDGGDLELYETWRKEIQDINYLVIVLIAVGLLLLLGLIYYFTSQRKPAPAPQPIRPGGPRITGRPDISQPAPPTPPGPQPGPRPSQPVTGPAPTPKPERDPYPGFSGESTVVVPKDYVTMKALSCSLTILSGEQAGQELPLYGAQTNEGTVVTFGRDTPDWKNHVKAGRENAHIRIKDNTRTLSRMQAEMVYRNGIMLLKNKGSANPTQVDGKSLEIGDAVELKNGAIIQAGHLKMRFNG